MDCQTLRYIQRCDIYNGDGWGKWGGGVRGHCVSSTKDEEASHGN